MSSPDIVGPFILWLNYGTEGWHPKSHPSIRAALEDEKYSCEWIITKQVSYDVTDTTMA